MENEIRQMSREPLEMPQNIADLVEEIRLASLNLAVASAKFKANNIRQALIKKDLTEVVALALESVQFISKFLEEIGIKVSQSSWLSDEIDHDRIDANLMKLRGYLESITNNFMKDKGLH
ncbi:MAG: hypothetical protein GWO41_07780 [candidate division Zixibacteria bacterium]|jgi:hypothetical protein|nr:hypothetical protein [candidate division Zixibacteria bacterium]NIS16232.1 hypothetical protein [candidate division Zixibacteria bacterium]NIS48731.1 hypothetical protein [candidate division Zixibacteria bacterium]NIT52624.1 hypothetical protein [candidate division Zixibacteria bacterium]NIU16803.1 hypothetical protein [candidate division Zixibacteria bacterium]